MTIISKTLTTSIFILLTYCASLNHDSQQEIMKTKEAIQSKSKTKDSLMINQGFQLGTIKYLDNSACEYIIIDHKSRAKFDPVNILVMAFEPLKKESQKIYFKYRPLRRMNRCLEANPILLNDIKKRDN